MEIGKLISEGEAGVSIGAIVGASRNNILTGGTCRAGYLTEKGPQRDALTKLGLVPHPSSSITLVQKYNSDHADVVVIITAHEETFSSLITYCEVKKQNCEITRLDDLERALDLLYEHYSGESVCLYITGDTESDAPGITKTTASRVAKAIKNLNDKQACKEV